MKFGTRGSFSTSIWDIFNLLVLKVIWGSFSALVSTGPVTQNWLAVEQNGLKFGTQSYLY